MIISHISRSMAARMPRHAGLCKATRALSEYNFILNWLLVLLIVTPFFGSDVLSEPRLPFRMPSMVEVRTIRSALLKTNKGDIVFELFPEVAPFHVANFKYLSEQGFFKGKKIERVIPNHVIMFGEPATGEATRYSYSLPPEFSDKRHLVGTLSMARDPRTQKNLKRHSSATKVHLLLSDNARMDGDFTAFGALLSGESVLKTLREGDTLLDLQVFVSGT